LTAIKVFAGGPVRSSDRRLRKWGGKKEVSIQIIGVIGYGLMGSGIAQVCAMAGYPTVVCEISPDRYQNGLRRIENSLGRFVEKSVIGPEAMEAALNRLHGVTELEALEGCSLVIEAITEDLVAKKNLFRELDGICQPTAIFATNTSSLSVTELMTATRRASSFVGLHFFNPVPVMALVEVVKTVVTAPSVYAEVLEFVRILGKTAIRCDDKPGFIVNRLLIPYLLDAIRAVEEGVGTIEEIDSGMKLGCGYPMGPLTLLDFVGLDTTYSIANIMYDAYKEKRFAPPPLLKQMVLAGRLGKKSGQGFYRYED
jgi:3-hydroxybutyryl-CoA dehydrogenase